jgi:hypothetical protein
LLTPLTDRLEKGNNKFEQLSHFPYQCEGIHEHSTLTALAAKANDTYKK